MYSSLRSFVTYLGIGGALVVILYGASHMFSPKGPQEAINRAKMCAARQASPGMGTVQEQPLPFNGQAQTYKRIPGRTAPFRITTAEGDHYYLKLVDAYNLTPVMTIFVRSHDIAEVSVPLGTYRVRYASGKSWYGVKRLFGDETVCGELDAFFRFDTSGEQVLGHTLTLYEVQNGDLTTSSIRPEDF